MDNADLLKVFTERIQKVVGWPEWKVWGGTKNEQDRRIVRIVEGGVWRVQHRWITQVVWKDDTEAIDRDNHEAASLVRGHLCGWLTAHRVSLAYRQGGGFGWALHREDGNGRVAFGDSPNENAALVAAFDETQKHTKETGDNS